MTPKSDPKFEENLTCCLKKDERNQSTFHRSAKKSQNPFIQSRIFMSLKLAEKLYVMTIKNDPKLGAELTCCFKIDIKNLKNFEVST